MGVTSIDSIAGLVKAPEMPKKTTSALVKLLAFSAGLAPHKTRALAAGEHPTLLQQDELGPTYAAVRAVAVAAGVSKSVAQHVSVVLLALC